MNSNNYILKTVNDNQFNFILISKDMSRLQDYIFDVEDELKGFKKKCFILFDLLLNNNIEDRFYKCYFDGNKLILNTLEKVELSEIDNKLILISSNYYLKNNNLFDELFFTNDYKNQIINNLKKSVFNPVNNSSFITLAI